MRLKKINIGHLQTPNNLFLAPLAGYTNAVFRQICAEAGAGLTFTEMVSAKGLCYNSEATRELLLVTEDDPGIRACQLFGAEPEYMERAAASEYIAPFRLIDINMGCPMPKIYNNGEGSALMNDFALAEKIIKAAKRSGKPVSVKFRIGLTAERLCAADFAKMCEDAGADMICVHGRTRDKIYAGEVNFSQIAAAKRAVSIPVIANGGVFCGADADKLMEETGCDGVAVARGAMSAPWIFAEITGKTVNKKAMVQKQLDLTYKLYGERFATVFMRKMIAFYVKGQYGSAALKERLFQCADRAEIETLLREIEF